MTPEPTTVMTMLGRIHADIAVIQKDIDWLKETNSKEHKDMKSHFKTLNGSVAKNSKWRIAGQTAIAILVFVVPYFIYYIYNH